MLLLEIPRNAAAFPSRQIWVQSVAQANYSRSDMMSLVFARQIELAYAQRNYHLGCCRYPSEKSLTMPLSDKAIEESLFARLTTQLFATILAKGQSMNMYGDFK